jgi:hypothetical protein
MSDVCAARRIGSPPVASGSFFSLGFFLSGATLSMVRRICFLPLILAMGCLGGVDPKQPKLEPVTGVVTLDSEPLMNADITFIPISGQIEAGGRTDADGKYTLIVRNQMGAAVGDYKVTISKRTREDGSEFPENRENVGAGKESLPPKYVDRIMTELKATVEPGENEINFDLKSK